MLPASVAHGGRCLINRLLAAAVLTGALAACGAQVAETASPVTASPSATPSAEPTVDPESAYAAAVCTDVVNAVPAIGRQMEPVLDAVFAEDAQALAREGAELQLLIADLLDALDRAPDYPPARKFESRLRASLDLFVRGIEAAQEGLAAFDEDKLKEGTGLFETSLSSFNEAKSEYQLLDFCP